jgi:hypothetical protein
MKTLNNVPMGVNSNSSQMVGEINIQKYGIASISVISEASWLPRMLIKHFDGKEFSYTVTKKEEDFKNTIERILREHIRINCVLAQRKEKLLRISEI